jgi:DNA-binding response OmpR family regulator
VKKLMSKPLAVIIEDQELLSEAFADALEMVGYDTLIVADGRSAMEQLGTLIPTLIVLDMNLPHVSGHYILKHLYADARLSPVPVIIATANSILADAVKRDLRSQDYLFVKPVRMAELQKIAKSILA